MDQRVITEWCQPLRSSKNVKPPKEAFFDRQFCVAGSSSSKALEALVNYSVKKLVVRPYKRPTKMEFDYELCLWLRVEKQQEDSPRHLHGRRDRTVEK